MSQLWFLAITAVCITALWIIVIIYDSGAGAFVALAMSVVWLGILSNDDEDSE